MARSRTNIPLNVFLNSRLVGVLNRETSGAINFTYHPDWLAWETPFPISLSLPLREDRYVGAPVINVFDNLLPDSDAIRRRVAERVNAAGTDAYSLLTALGHDCVGALQFLPEGVAPGPAGSIEGKPINEAEIAELITNLAASPLGVHEEDDEFRISIAGVQEKTALLRKDQRWFKPIGTTATTHIFKPQIGRLPNGIDLSNSVENEHLCLMLLNALDVPSATTEMATFGDRRTLIVERFDRRWTRDGRLLRLPQEDICQALSIPPSRKYQSDNGPNMRTILDLLKGSDTPDEDISTFMRASIVFWLLGATDGHGKNFSVFLNPSGRFQMTPLYDVLSAQPSVDANQVPRKKFKLAMSVGKQNHYAVHDIMPRHFIQTAELAGVGEKLVGTIFDKLIETAPETIEKVIAGLPKDYPSQVTQPIQKGFIQRLQLCEDWKKKSD